jgi:hypothetical protein
MKVADVKIDVFLCGFCGLLFLAPINEMINLHNRMLKYTIIYFS